MMGSHSLVHWLILLVVVVVIFGTSKLKNAGKDLGSAVKGFKDAVKEDEKPKHIDVQSAPQPPIQAEVTEVKSDDKA